MTTVGIVGGGLTGLALTHYLSRSGIESVVFEAASEPGGVVRSVDVDGRTLDLGPQRTRLSPPVAALVRSLDIEEDLVEARDLPLYVYRDGRLRRVPFTAREAVTTDLLSWRGKLRALLEPLVGPPRDGETVEAFLTRTFGSEVATYIAGPLYGGLYGSNPGEMYVEHSLARALRKHGASRSLLATAARAKLRRSDPPAVVSFADGMQTLPRALSERHRDRVRLDTPVETVRKTDGRYELRTSTDATAVESVVFTTPADVTAALLADVAPDAAAGLDRLAYNPLAVVHLESDAELAASGYKIPHGEEFRTLGVTCNAALFGRDGVYTCFLGGSKTPGLVDWPTTEIRETAEREFAAITGHDARTLHVERLSPGMPAYDTTWTALERVETPADIHLCANYESRAGIPGRIAEAKALADRLAEADRSASAARVSA